MSENQSPLSRNEKRLLQETLRRYRSGDIPDKDNSDNDDNNDKSRTNGLLGAASLSAILVFLGSMTGTLLGTFTSINDLYESIERIEDVVNPPAEVCVAGSNTILGEGLGMAAQWEAGFESETERINVTVNPTGSLTGLQLAVDRGCVHVLAMSEAMTDEQARELEDNNVEIQCAAEIGYDVIAFVTHNDNELPSLLERQMSGVLMGRYTSWEDVYGEDQSIYIYARPGSGTTDHVLREFGWALGAEEFPPEASYLYCDTNGDCLDKTLSTPGSLYWVSTSWMRTQPPRYLRVLPILPGDERPINPLVDNFNIQQYPDKLVRPLYMYVLNNGTMDEQDEKNAETFLRYVRSVNGQEILENNHFYTHFNRPVEVNLNLPRGFSERTDGPRTICKLIS
jgi:ABC-type phosphate transport system substrate-binding protein